jgi:hypothetical protein
MVKSAPSGMLGEEMGNRMGAVRNDAVRGPSAGQATLRRLLGGDPTSDRVSTHVIFGGKSNQGLDPLLHVWLLQSRTSISRIQRKENFVFL